MSVLIRALQMLAGVVVVMGVALVATAGFYMYQSQETKEYTPHDIVRALGVESGKVYPANLGRLSQYGNGELQVNTSAGLFFLGSFSTSTSLDVQSGDAIRVGFTSEQGKSYIFAVPMAKVVFSIAAPGQDPSIVFNISDDGDMCEGDRCSSTGYMVKRGNFFTHAGRLSVPPDPTGTRAYAEVSKYSLSEVLPPLLDSVSITLTSQQYTRYLGGE